MTSAQEQTPPTEQTQYTLDDFLCTLMELAYEEESQFKAFGATWRKRRADILDRFIILLDVGRARVVPELRKTAEKLRAG